MITSLTVNISRAVSQVSSIASSSRDPQLCDQMKGSLIKKQVTASWMKWSKILRMDYDIKESSSLPVIKKEVYPVGSRWACNANVTMPPRALIQHNNPKWVHVIPMFLHQSWLPACSLVPSTTKSHPSLPSSEDIDDEEAGKDVGEALRGCWRVGKGESDVDLRSDS